MTVIPGNQDQANFLNGGYSQPQVINSQVPGAANLPQIGAPVNGILSQPTSQSFHTAVLNAIANSIPKSSTNHAVGNGGWNNTLSEPSKATAPMPAASPVPYSPIQNSQYMKRGF